MREPSSGTAVQDGGRPSPGAAQDPDGAVVCAGLTKDYGQGRGVFDLDLTIRRGETFGFVGPNGAGKTTTIRLLMDLIRPDRGTATILGRDSRRDSLAIKRQVGFLPGELPQFPGVSAGYVIGLLAGLRGGVDPALAPGNCGSSPGRNPTWRLIARLSRRESRPRIVAVPRSGRIRSMSRRIVVVLPAPFGPTKPKVSPRRIVRSRSKTPRPWP